MFIPVLTTKLYIPRTGSNVVVRPRLIKRLNDGLHRKLTLVSAPAGFGKTTLVSEWVAGCERQVAWLSLDAEDSDPTRFLTYLIAALQTISDSLGSASIGQSVLRALQTPQPPPIDALLPILLNEITTIKENFVFLLDDYHVIESPLVDNALNFIVTNLPPQMHLVIATREDPQLPLARLRARGHLSELRATDLRFDLSEAVEFLNKIMGLNLSSDDVAALEARTEGWIAGLQLAALSMQGYEDTSGFLQSFTGSHHFVMDYLVEEVLHQQSEPVQKFLLHTSILNRMCGALCDAVLLDESASGQEILEYIEQANLFIIPLDNKRRWYRYHHLFADLLRQRLHQKFATSPVDSQRYVNELHIRASQWYEDNGLEIEAFHHAAAANDIDRAERLIEGKGIPLHLRGAVTAILDWLEALPTSVMNARPTLWWRHGSLLLVNGQTTGVEEKLNAAESALQGREVDDKTRNFIGQIATARAVLALTRYQAETMLIQSRRALEYLSPKNLPLRANANWTMGIAYLYQGDRAAARLALTEAISISQSIGNVFTTILATVGLGNVQEVENQLYQAAETYLHVLQLAGDQPQQIVYEAHLGLAHIHYEWNDLNAAEQYGRQSLHLARQYDRVIDRFIVCEVFLARVKLAQGDVAGAAAILAQAAQAARQQNFIYRIPEVAAAQVLTLLRQGNLTAAAHLAQTHDLPMTQARVLLAQGDTPAVLTVLEAFRQQVEAKGWQDERLRAMVLQVVALSAYGEKDKALRLLRDALVLAEPGGFIRIFVDEGTPIAELLPELAAQGLMPDYTSKLLAAFEAEHQPQTDSPSYSLIEPLSQRELEVLRLIAQGLSNHEIGERLFLALDTVKGHNRRIYDKLNVQRRTEAVARAQELGLL